MDTITLQGKTFNGKTACAVNVPADEEIWVCFKDGTGEAHPMREFFQLAPNPKVEYIFSNVTGELYCY